MKFGLIKNYVNGEFVSASGEIIDIYSPLDGTVIGQVKNSTKQDFEEAIKIAKIAQKEWGAMTFKKRSEILYNYRSILIKNKEELAQIDRIENGKDLSEAYAEIDKSLELTEFACSIAQIATGEISEVSVGVVCREERRPIGVVGVITPFNFPMMVPHWSLPNAIALGNAVVLKPSEVTPICANKIAEMWKEAGLPNGILTVLHGGKDIVEAICDSKELAAVSFVGSTQVAEIVYKRGTQTGKRVLALGGAKNHIVLMPDVDPVIGSRDIMASAFGMSGQRCMAASVIVGVGNVEPIITQLINDTKNSKTLTVITEKAIDTISKYIEYAISQEAKILVDGREKIDKNSGYNIGPTIVDWRGAKGKMKPIEVFGPILELVEANSISQAAEIQRESPYGNAGAIFTQNGKYVEEALREFEAGMLGVNIGVPVPREPFSFGGTKDSKFGYGDITGKSSINFWTDLIKITTKWNAENKKDWMS